MPHGVAENSHASPDQFCENITPGCERLQTIVACDDDGGHKYSRAAGACPWCEIENAGGPNFFISVSVLTFSKSTAYRDPTMLWAAIVNITFPDRPFLSAQRYSTSKLAPLPLPEQLSERRLLQTSVGWVAAVSGCASPIGFVLPSAIALAPIAVAIVFVIWWLMLLVTSPRYRERASRTKACRSAKSELNRLQSEMSNTKSKYEGDFKDVMNVLTGAMNEIQAVNRDKAIALQSLHANVRDRQLAAYLDKFFIASARIKGIGSGRVATLASYGIETAADIEAGRVFAIPGFGDKLTGELLVWRHQVSAGFRFDPTKGVPQSEIQNLEIKFQHKQQQYERRLQLGPEHLKSIIKKAATHLHQIDRKISLAELKLAQADLDLSICP